MTTTTITWHKVAEQLPDDDELVLVAHEDAILGYLEDGKQWRDETGWPMTVAPTWWTHVPEGPK